jgi:superfamily II DNA/RNA helicase
VEVKLAVSKPAEKIQQGAYICTEPQKLGIIQHLFTEEPAKRVIIFASSKLKVKEVTKALQRMKLNVGEMHSDLDQAQRDAVMHEFKNDRVDILVATDIVSRGIDIDDITLVINFDVPHDCEDYVHRIGRTARAGNEGRAITFVGPKDQTRFHTIEEFIEKEVEKLPVPEALGEAPAYNPERKNSHGRGRSRGGKSNGGHGRGGRKPSASRKQNKGKSSTSASVPTPASAPSSAPANNNTPNADAPSPADNAPKKKRRNHRGGKNRHGRKPQSETPPSAPANNE